jgi:uncharacterized membrane protein
VFTRFIFWPWFTGLAFMIGGLLLVRRKLVAAPGLDKLIVLGPVLYAIPLTVFAAEHLAGAQFLMQGVPNWMPARLFWAYFVGMALLAAAFSILFKRYVRLSGTLLGIMFFLFVLLIHVPRVFSSPHDRISWTVVLRDLAFGGAAWALAGGQSPRWRLSVGLITTGRFCIAIPTIFFGVEYILHPRSAPGVPLPKLTPPWVPLGAFWGYLTGAVLLIAGIALLVNKKGRIAATWAGLLITLAVLFIYLPLLPLASQPAQMNEATNYIADTMLYAGTILLLAAVLPAEHEASRP